MAVQGAMICGPQWICDLMVNFARPFIYSTGPSPWMAAALNVSIRFVENAVAQRDMLSNLCRRFLTACHQFDLPLCASEGPIFFLRWLVLKLRRMLLSSFGSTVSIPA